MSKPWKAGWGDGKWSATHEDANICGHAHIVDSTGTVVAMAVTVGRNDDDAERRDLIIRAVNAHDDLLEALRSIEGIASGSTTANSLPHIQKIATAALAKAEGRT